MTITYVVEEDHLYVNMTNRCPNACGFCVRSLNERKEGEADLWLEREPTREEILEHLKEKDLDSYRELIFCGYGEPTCRFDDLVWLCQQVRQISCVNIRLNTNGLSDLINGRSTAPELDGLLDSVSISLNASTPEKYQEICHSEFGLEALPAILKFTKTVGLYVPKVYMTVVDNMPHDEISACERLCHETGATFRVREFLDHQSYVEK